MVRHGLKQLINAEPDLEVCAEMSDAKKGLDAALRLKPDLVCVDISLKGSGNGIDFIKNIKAQLHKTRTLVVSMHSEALYAFRALRAGARGYVMKEEATSQVVKAVQVVTNGGIYLSERLRQQVLLNLVQGDGLSGCPVDILSDRELEILQLIGDGMTVREIAGQLKISLKTVETHRANIRDKLNLSNSRELAHFALLWVTEKL